MMARSSSAKPFHRAPRKITNAHAATTAYSRQPASASSHRAAGAAAVAVTLPSVLAPARRSRWRQARGAGEQRIGGEGVPPEPAARAMLRYVVGQLAQALFASASSES